MDKKFAIGWHPFGTPLFLAPDFTRIALGDEATIAEAIDIVVQAKKKSMMPAAKNALISDVSKIAGNVGELRALSDEEWKIINDKVPWMCSIYLKHLVEQAVALSHQQLLECDFNSGLPLELSAKQLEDLQTLMNLGFTRDQAVEALIVCNNKVESAAQYLTIEDDAGRAMQREEARKKLARSVAPNRHWTVVEQKSRENEQLTSWVKKSRAELDLQLAQLKRQLNSERKATQKLEKEVEGKVKANAVALYTEYLKGIMAEPVISSTEIQALDDYRRQRDLDEEDHKRTLKQCYMDEEKFEAMKKFDTETNTGNDECVVCYEPPKDHMLIPCNHLCLCAECADEYRGYGDEGTCPLCDEQIKDIQQVYYN